MIAFLAETPRDQEIIDYLVEQNKKPYRQRLPTGKEEGVSSTGS
jgi:hypothetical protein